MLVRVGGQPPHMWTHTHVNHGKHDCLHGSDHLQFLNKQFLALCACACVHMGEHPMSRDTPTPVFSPEPWKPESVKIQ